jgi:general secretion pathway protein J
LAAPSRPQAGFTLVEMLVSLLIFSIIAGIATAMATGATRSFAASQGVLGAITALDDTRAILAADLGQAARRPNLAADGNPMPAFTTTPEGFVLVRHRSPGAVPAIEKVAWGLVDGRLLRQPFPAIDGAEPGDPVVMATGLSAVRIRVATSAGWSDSWVPTRPEDLPRALELTMVRTDGVAIVLKLMVAG